MEQLEEVHPRSKSKHSRPNGSYVSQSIGHLVHSCSDSAKNSSESALLTSLVHTGCWCSLNAACVDNALLHNVFYSFFYAAVFG